MNKSEIERVLSKAKELGLKGWFGHCASAAIAINRVLFGGEGEYVLACNQALLDKGCLVGHVAVKYDGQYWDADGHSKELVHIESWGMLDEHDPELMVYFDESDPWDERKAYDVVVYYFSDDEVSASPIMRYSMMHLEHNVKVLSKAVAEQKKQFSDDREHVPYLAPNGRMGMRV